MIRSKLDYYIYLQADRDAAQIPKRNIVEHAICNLCYIDYIWNYILALRRVEYYHNVSTSLAYRAYYYYWRCRLHKLQMLLGITISPNCVDKGLYIPHIGCIIIHHRCRIGCNFTINIDTVIGSNIKGETPIIGDNVVIEPGAKIYGNIYIANGIVVGANSVVNKSFLEEDISIAGIPARKISNKGTSKRRRIDCNEQ